MAVFDFVTRHRTVIVRTAQAVLVLALLNMALSWFLHGSVSTLRIVLALTLGALLLAARRSEGVQ